MDNSLLKDQEQRIASVHKRIAGSIASLEEKRLNVRKRTKTFYIILFFTIAVIVLLFIFLFSRATVPIIALSMVLLIALILFYYFYVTKYKSVLVKEFNQHIVPVIIGEFFPEASFNRHYCIQSSEYYASRLFLKSVDRYSGKNYFNGYFGETNIHFSQLHTEYKTGSRDKNGNPKTTWHTIFEGVFMIADSNKHFKGSTFILPDKAEKMFGGVGKWLQEKVGSQGRGELVYLENPEFEKHFVVYSTDPVEARYLLTPSMQQYFVELFKHIGNRPLFVSYIGEHIYLGLSGRFNFFGMDLNRTFNDVETIKYYSRHLIHILSVIEILDLNTRIWGK